MFFFFRRQSGRAVTAPRAQLESIQQIQCSRVKCWADLEYEQGEFVASLEFLVSWWRLNVQAFVSAKC